MLIFPRKRCHKWGEVPRRVHRSCYYHESGVLEGGVSLSVRRGNGKSCSLCIPGQRASSEQNFEIRQSSVTYSLWLFRFFPTSDEGHRGPCPASPATCMARLRIYPPLSSPILSRPTGSATEDVREKITTTDEGLAAFLWVLAFFNHRPL